MKNVILYQEGGSGMGGPALNERLNIFMEDIEAEDFIKRFCSEKHNYFNDCYMFNDLGYKYIKKLGWQPANGYSHNTFVVKVIDIVPNYTIKDFMSGEF